MADGRIKGSAALAVVFVALLVAGFLAGCRWREKRPLTGPIVRVDTLLIFDTIRVQAPKETATKPAGAVAAVLPVAADSSGEQVPAKDSVSVLVPLVSSVYSGPTWTAYVTGYHAAIDSLVFIHTTQQITKTVADLSKRFHGGAFASVEVSTIAPVGRAGGVCAFPISEDGRWFMDIRGGYEAMYFDGWHHGPFIEAGVRLTF